MVRGEGLRTWDVDGNEYRDFLGNYTSLILGHAHPAVVEAVIAQVRKASAFAAPTEVEVELAEEIRRRLPSLERLRFTNSGTEATMFAIRAARAFTGRDLVARFDHAYHGTHDTVLPHSPGVPTATSDLVVDLPWGDADGVERELAGRERELAAIIIEPVQGAGGVRAADPAFLRFLRDFTTRIGAVLIFDEIIAFRVGPNGAQGLLRRRAGPHDARQDRRRRLRARGVRRPGRDHGPLRRPAAGRDEPRRDVQRQPRRRGGRPRDAARADAGPLRRAWPSSASASATRLASSIAGAGIDARVDGIASLFQVFAGPTLEGEDGLTASQTLFLGLLVDGFHLAPRGMGAISTPVTERDVDDLADAIVARLAAMSGAAGRVPAATR